jgi:predicted Zn finger-like uncharacterized protein
MALATRCPNCHALFRVAADQLKLRGGLVRCGACHHAFDATGTLSYIDDATASTSAHPAAPAVGRVIAAIRKAESTASESLAGHGPAPFALESTAARPMAEAPSAVPESDAETPADADATLVGDAAAEEALPEAGPPELTEEEVGVAPRAAATDAGQAGEDALPSGPATVDDEQAVAEPVTPTFLREADAQKRRRRKALFGVGAFLLAALLLAQLAVAFRAELLARFPQARPALEGLCRAFRCTVDWPARGDLLAVVGSELQALPGTGAYELTAVVRNRGSITLALPAIELTLSDTLNRTVARKVFSPADYLAGEAAPQARMRAGLEPGADLTVRIAFEAPGVNAAGFVVYPFYL